MATAKEGLKKGVPVKSFMSGKTIKVECETCYNEESSYACIRPAHQAWKAKNPNAPVTKEILATSITQISDAVKKLYASGLNRRAVVALIADDTKLGKGAIETVLDSLQDLSKNYTTAKGTNFAPPKSSGISGSTFKQIEIAQSINRSGVLPNRWEELGLTETRYYWYKFMYTLFWRTLCPCPDGRFLRLRNWVYNITGRIAYRYHKKLCTTCAHR